jgi:hypothetical protein
VDAMKKVLKAIRIIDSKFKQYGSSFKEGFGTDKKSIEMIYTNTSNKYWGQATMNWIKFYDDGGDFEFCLGLIIHELGHVFSFRLNNLPAQDWDTWNKARPGWIMGPTGFMEEIYRLPGSGFKTYYFGDFNDGAGEEFADMFVALMLDQWPTGEDVPPNYQSAAAYRKTFMTVGMFFWLNGSSAPAPGSPNDF